MKKRFLAKIAALSIAVTCAFSASVSAASMWEPFDRYNTGVWSLSNGYSNGSPFGCDWSSGNASFSGGQMNLSITKGNNKYYGAELKSNSNYGYGFFETNMICQKHVGTISSLFTYTGPSYGTVWDEIDIEFLGKTDANGRPILQLNYYTNGVGNHEQSISLGYDPSTSFHKYGFNWRNGSIKWYVDRKQVGYTATNNIPKTPGRIMMNLWNIDNSSGPINWVGRWDGVTNNVSAKYDYTLYDSGLNP